MQTFDKLCAELKPSSGPKPDPRRVAAALLLSASPDAAQARGATYAALTRCGVPQAEHRAAKQTTDALRAKIVERGLCAALPAWVKPPAAEPAAASETDGRKRARTSDLEVIIADVATLHHKVCEYMQQSQELPPHLSAALDMLKESCSALPAAIVEALPGERNTTCASLFAEPLDAEPPGNHLLDDHPLVDNWLSELGEWDAACDIAEVDSAPALHRTLEQHANMSDDDRPPADAAALLADGGGESGNQPDDSAAGGVLLLAVACWAVVGAPLVNVLPETRDVEALFGDRAHVAENVSPQEVADLLDALLPRVLLFSGHGDLPWLGPGGGVTLGFVGSRGQVVGMHPARLAAMFGSRGACSGGCLTLVVLNSCRTDMLARAVRDAGVPFVLGWRTKVHDRGARLFIHHFFAACAAGKPVPAAFLGAKQACIPHYLFGDPDDVQALTSDGRPTLGVPALFTRDLEP